MGVRALPLLVGLVSAIALATVAHLSASASLLSLGLAGAAGFLLGLSVWAALGDRTRVLTLAAATTSVVLSLGAALAVVRTAGTVNPRARSTVADALRVDHDFRGIAEVVRDLRAAGERAFPAASTRELIRDGAAPPLGLLPLSGVSNVLTVVKNETGVYPLYRSDRYGFNNDDAAYDRPVEVVIVGDSFAQGRSVARGVDPAGALRAAGIPAITTGMAGSGPLLELAALGEYAAPHRPAWVVWLYFAGNDLFNLEYEELRVEALHRYLEDGFSQHLIERQEEVDAFWIPRMDEELEHELAGIEARSLRERLAASRFWQTTHLQRTMLGGITPVVLYHERPIAEATFGELERVICAGARRARQWGGRLLFVYLPSYEALLGEVPHRERVLGAASRCADTVLDLETVLLAEADPETLFPYRFSAHYNERGYALVTRALESVLRPTEPHS
jgi:hypothetical protein